jgi:hypothetical protein
MVLTAGAIAAWVIRPQANNNDYTGSCGKARVSPGTGHATPS